VGEKDSSRGKEKKAPVGIEDRVGPVKTLGGGILAHGPAGKKNPASERVSVREECAREVKRGLTSKSFIVKKNVRDHVSRDSEREGGKHNAKKISIATLGTTLERPEPGRNDSAWGNRTL